MSTALDFDAWVDRAACAAHPADWWTHPTDEHRRTALRVCGDCTVRADCLEFGIVHDTAMSWPAANAAAAPIFGGFTHAERVHWAHMSAATSPVAVGAG